MAKSEMLERTWRRPKRSLGIATIGLSLTAAHPGAHDTQRAPFQSEQEAPADAVTPVETVTAFHAALARGDIDAALTHLAEDVVILNPATSKMAVPNMPATICRPMLPSAPLYAERSSADRMGCRAIWPGSSALKRSLEHTEPARSTAGRSRR